jgi:hypothetical protein
MSSVQAANDAYMFGTQELQWAQQQFGLEWPYMQQSATQNLQAQANADAFSANQQAFYEQQYQPMEASYDQQVQNWGSPDNIALQTGMAEANVNEAVGAQKTAAQNQLEGYGVNPGATRFGGLYDAMGVMGGAAAAGAGTNAAMQTRLQAMQLESGAINTGRGFPSAVAGLTGAGTGAGGTAGSTLQGALTSGAGAMTAGASLYNAGASNMGVYVNAVNGYNQTNLGYAQLGAQEMAGLFGGIGSLAGGYMGMQAAKGGPIERFDAGGTVDPIAESTPPSATNYDIGADSFAKGFSGTLGASKRYKEDKAWSSDLATLNRPAGASGSGGAYSRGGVIPTRYQGGGAASQGQAPTGMTPQQYRALDMSISGNINSDYANMPPAPGSGFGGQAAYSNAIGNLDDQLMARQMLRQGQPTPSQAMQQAGIDPGTASAQQVLFGGNMPAGTYPGYGSYGGGGGYAGGYGGYAGGGGGGYASSYGGGYAGGMTPNSVASPGSNPAIPSSTATSPIMPNPMQNFGPKGTIGWSSGPHPGYYEDYQIGDRRIHMPANTYIPPSAYGYEEGGMVSPPGSSMPVGMYARGNIVQGPMIPPRGGTPGGFVPPQMSPSQGQTDDDVDAKLTAGEFVMPKDVVNWEGQKKFVGMIDNARKQKAILDARGDIGGEPAGPGARPSPNPAFVSRPTAMPARAMA